MTRERVRRISLLSAYTRARTIKGKRENASPRVTRHTPQQIREPLPLESRVAVQNYTLLAGFFSDAAPCPVCCHLAASPQCGGACLRHNVAVLWILSGKSVSYPQYNRQIEGQNLSDTDGTITRTKPTARSRLPASRLSISNRENQACFFFQHNRIGNTGFSIREQYAPPLSHYPQMRHGHE